MEGIKKALTVENGKDFIKRGVFSSEFLLVLVYFGVVVSNKTFQLGLSDVDLADLRSFVYLWAGIRQVGKAVSYKTGGTQ